jgi:hypothetical protein
VTALDAIGPYEILSRLPGASLVFVGAATGPVRTDTGRLTLVAEASWDEVPAPDLVLVPYATAAGVSAGLDLALDLAARIAGVEVAQTIQLAVEYDPEPPFSAGSPRTAPPAIVAALRARPHLVLDA